MTLDSFRQLLALRYAAESVEELNVFLARVVEMQVGMQKQGVYNRVVGHAGAAAVAFAVVASIGVDLVAPVVAIIVYLAIVGFQTKIQLTVIKEQDQAFRLNHDTVRDYLSKATRDRLENRVSIAIQNRKAAAELLNGDPLSEDDEALLKANIVFWGARLKDSEARLNKQEESGLWNGYEDACAQIRGWIKTESGARPFEA